jgi:uncharacterized membrane protein YwaF
MSTASKTVLESLHITYKMSKIACGSSKLCTAQFQIFVFQNIHSYLGVEYSFVSEYACRKCPK